MLPRLCPPYTEFLGPAHFHFIRLLFPLQFVTTPVVIAETKNVTQQPRLF